MKVCFSILLIFFMTLPCFGIGVTRQVPSQYSTIQSAINACNNGDVVRVADGTYSENIDFIGKQIKVRSANGAENCIIDGGQNGPCVSFENGEGNNSILNGFTLTNGAPDTGTSLSVNWNGGSGVWISCSSPTVKECIIIGNTSPYQYGYYSVGAGLFVIDEDGSYYSDVIVQDCLFEENEALNAHAMAILHQGADAEIKNNIFYHNESSSANGSTFYSYLYEDGASLLYNTFYSTDNLQIQLNKSAEEGGDYYICGNVIYDSLAGVDLGGHGTFHLINNTITGVYNGVTVTPSDMTSILLYFYNNIVWDYEGWAVVLYGNDFPIYSYFDYNDIYNDIYGLFAVGKPHWEWGAYNMDVDPDFVDYNNGDLHLNSTSDLIDQGSDSVEGLPEYDIDGEDRIQGDEPDIGADEVVSE